MRGLQVTYGVWESGELTQTQALHEHGNMGGACSFMTIVDGDRYSSISVFASPDKVNVISINTD